MYFIWNIFCFWLSPTHTHKNRNYVRSQRLFFVHSLYLFHIQILRQSIFDSMKATVYFDLSYRSFCIFMLDQHIHCLLIFVRFCFILFLFFIFDLFFALFCFILIYVQFHLPGVRILSYIQCRCRFYRQSLMPKVVCTWTIYLSLMPKRKNVKRKTKKMCKTTKFTCAIALVVCLPNKYKRW